MIGLGDMGSGMAKNLIGAGFSVVGFDLRDERLAALEQMGGRRAASGAEVAGASDVVFVMVLNGSQVQEAVLGPEGLLGGLEAGKTVPVVVLRDGQQLTLKVTLGARPGRRRGR